MWIQRSQSEFFKINQSEFFKMNQSENLLRNVLFPKRSDENQLQESRVKFGS